MNCSKSCYRFHQNSCLDWSTRNYRPSLLMDHHLASTILPGSAYRLTAPDPLRYKWYWHSRPAHWNKLHHLLNCWRLPRLTTKKRMAQSWNHQTPHQSKRRKLLDYRSAAIHHKSHVVLCAPEYYKYAQGCLTHPPARYRISG